MLQTLSLSLLRPVPLFMQAEAAECGLAVIGMVARYLGVDTDLDALRRLHPVSTRGMTLKTLIEIGDRLGLGARAVRLEPDELSGLRLPAVLHWDLNHFVVLTKVTARGAWINDPARGTCFVTLPDIRQHFTGIAAEFTRVAKADVGPPEPKVRIDDLWSGIFGLRPALATAFSLALIVQLLSLLVPVATQVAIDHAIPKADADFLFLICLALIVAHIVRTIGNATYNYLVTYVAAAFSFQILGNVFRRILSLSPVFFSQRRLGDVTSRFASAQAVQSFVSQSIVSIALDIITLAGALLAMSLYNGTLALLSCVGLALSLAVASFAYRHLFSEAYQGIEAQVRQLSLLIESIRAIQAIKLYGYEALRFAVWQNALADSISANYRLTRLRAVYGAIGGGISVAVDVAIFYLSARMVMTGEFTLGMMAAFAAWRSVFGARAGSAVQALFGFQSLRLNLDRLGDIVRAEPEDVRHHADGRTIRQGRLTLREVSFRYAANDEEVVSKLSIDVTPTEWVAITGPSGGGKTTILKIMVGLLRPSGGDILVDDVPLSTFGLAPYRRQIGVVMQDDQLLSGAILDNITFFDQAPDLEQVHRVLQISCLDADIQRMPMGLHSLVGEMGSSLSGGQTQRLLLARALYRRPRILFMDEGTAHLDSSLEARINDNIRALKVTRITIAHRSETIQAADRILVLANGSLRSAP